MQKSKKQGTRRLRTRNEKLSLTDKIRERKNWKKKEILLFNNYVSLCLRAII